MAGYSKSFDNILSITVIGIVMVFVIYYSYTSYNAFINRKKPDPRPFPKCPDYWESIGDGKCRNTHKIGTCRTGNSPDDTVDFNSDIFTDKTSGNYMKCKWAKECHAPWEGISDLCV